MLFIILIYSAIALWFLYSLLVRTKAVAGAPSMVDIINRVGEERSKSERGLKRLRIRLDSLLSAACKALAWPSTLGIMPLVLRHRDMRHQFRALAVMHLYAVELLLQPVVVLSLFGLALFLHAQADPPDRLTCTVAYALIAYATFYQLKLLVSPNQIKVELKRTLWDPRVKATVIALIQLASLATAYAAIKSGTPLDLRSVLGVARALANQQHLLALVFGETSTGAWEVCVAASGTLLAAAILRIAIKFWALTRNDDDRINLATTQLLAARFEDALRTLEHIKNRSAESELRRGVAMLARGDLDMAIKHARHFWSLNTDKEVSHLEAAAKLLGSATLLLVPWPSIEALLERCLANAPTDAKVYASMDALVQGASAPLDRLEAIPRTHASEDPAYGPLLAYFLFSINRRDEADAIVRASACVDPMARAVSSYLRIAAPTFQHSDSAERAKQTFDRLCIANLDAFEKACDENHSADDLKFLIMLAFELEGLGRRLKAERLSHAVAIHAKLQERHRLVAPAHESGDLELVLRSGGGGT